MEVTNLATARAAFLKYVAEDKKYTTADKLHQLIPAGIESLEAMPDKERRDVVDQIMKEAKNKYIPRQRMVAVKE